MPVHSALPANTPTHSRTRLNKAYTFGYRRYHDHRLADRLRRRWPVGCTIRSRTDPGLSWPGAGTRAASGIATALTWNHRRQSSGAPEIVPVWSGDHATEAELGWALWIETAVVHRWGVSSPAEVIVEAEWAEAPIVVCHGYQLGYCGLTDEEEEEDDEVLGTAAAQSTTPSQSLHANEVVATVDHLLATCAVSRFRCPPPTSRKDGRVWVCGTESPLAYVVAAIS